MLAAHQAVARREFLERFTPDESGVDQQRWLPLAHGPDAEWALRLWSLAAWALLLLPASWVAAQQLGGVLGRVLASQQGAGSWALECWSLVAATLLLLHALREAAQVLRVPLQGGELQAGQGT